MHLGVKIISRSKDQSLTAKVAYNNRTNLIDSVSKKKHYQRSKGGLRSSTIVVPENAPPQLQEIAENCNLEAFCQLVEEAEKRRDSQLLREIEIALPHELTLEQNINLLNEYVECVFVNQGMVANIAVHEPTEKNDPRNIHAHILLSMREILPGGFGKKIRSWNKMVPYWRDQWEAFANSHLLRAGHSSRVCMKSYKRRGVLKEPTRYQGPVKKKTVFNTATIAEILANNTTNELLKETREDQSRGR